MDQQEDKPLLLNPAKSGIITTNKDPFRAKKFDVKIHKPLDPPAKQTIVASFYYIPVITKPDAKILAKTKNYSERLCIELFEHINKYFGTRIAFHFVNHCDKFPIAQEVEFENVKKRIIDQADFILNLYETNKIEEKISFFATKFLWDKNEKIAIEVETASNIEYNRLIDEPQKKKVSKANLRQQMLLLKHFGYIDCIDNNKINIEKFANVTAILLNKDEDNIRHYLTTIRFLNNHIKGPADYRKYVEKKKLYKDYDIYTPKNLKFLNQVLAELGLEQV